MIAHIRTQATGSAADIAQISLAILLSAFILLGTAIVQIDAVHNAAHDSRHSLAFPCH